MRTHRNLKLRKLVNSINHDQLNHCSQQKISPSELPVDITSLIKKCDVMLDLFYDAGLQQYIESDQPKTMRDDTESVDFRDILYAICGDEHDHDSAMNPDRISLYEFLKRLKVANNIIGSIENISAGCFHLGTKKIGNCSIGFVFARKANNLLVAGIKSLCAEKKLVVITLAKKVQIMDRNIINISLAESLRNDYRLEIDLSPLDIVDDGLTDQQNRDYEQFGYRCYDKIRITGQAPKNRSYTIFMNDKPVRLGESLFKLLLRFVKELKKGQCGWVSVYDLYDEGLINDPEKYQKYSDLRRAIEGKSISGNGKDLIENDGSKNYRLSVHPDFVDVDVDTSLPIIMFDDTAQS